MSEKKSTPSVEESTQYENLLGVREQTEHAATLEDFIGEEIHVPEEPWQQHWVGMPEFEQEDNSPYKTIYVHFRTEEDYKEFAQLINQKLSKKTKSIWHPKLDRTANSLLRWVEEE